MDRALPQSAMAARCAAALRRSLFVALLVGFTPAASAQDDGARLYMMVPADTTVASIRLHHLDSNVAVDPGAATEGPGLNTKLVVGQFVQALEIAGRQSFVFLVVPGSRIESDVAGGPPSVSGLGDAQLGFVFGVLGTPSLRAPDYATHRPGLAVNLLAKLFFPTGAYSQARSINVGANRWAVRLGVPIVYAVGEGMGDPGLMTVELMPTVTFFGVNNAPFGGTRAQQDPLFLFEGHLTRGFARDFWASIDVLWRRGGEVALDGNEQNNFQRALSLGATGTFALGPASSLRLSGGKVVDSNDHGPNGWLARAIIGVVF